jgi:hypothetical protein
MQYKLSLAQISNATIETLCHGSQVHAFASKPISFDPVQMRTFVNDEAERDDLMKAENRMTAIMCKRIHGLSLVWEFLRTTIQKNSGL